MNAATHEADFAEDAVPLLGAEDRDGPWPDAETALDADGEVIEAFDSVAGPGLPASVTHRQLVDWIEAIIDRDERALASLYNATFSRVYGLARRIVRQPGLAEEVVEDTYFQVWRQAVRFDLVRGNPLAWLLAITRSRAIDALRHEARFQHADLDDSQAQHAVDATPPSDELLDLARHHADLERALLLLDAQPRQLVSLAFFRGLTHDEIAAQTCLPLGTVKSQIRRAMGLLRESLSHSGLTSLAT